MRQIVERNSFLRGLDFAHATHMAQVLLVEDDVDTGRMLSRLLTKRRHTVVVAENGAVALAALCKGFCPDLVIADLQMPIMDGVSFLDNLRSFKKYETVPVVVMSARAPWAADELRPYRVAALLTKGNVDFQLFADSVDRLDARRLGGSVNGPMDMTGIALGGQAPSQFA